jgi:16S rRNA (cytidine1402-2'-O)-methyltransferase
MLYLIATPIGNLKDITLRAIEVLKACDYILCEDTRHSRPLLQHYEIDKPLKSFHKFNEKSRHASILEDLSAGKTIGLISDAGTPGIADPGATLVQQCREEGLAVSAIPGPCAAITGLTLSGLNTERFQFVGFLPKTATKLRATLTELLEYPGTSICYESPYRLLKTIEMIQTLDTNRLLVVTRELTKKFEEIVRGDSAALLAHFTTNPLKGEFVLLIEGKSGFESDDLAKLQPEDHVQRLMDTLHLSLNEAIKQTAQARGVPKREIYNRIHGIEKD